MATASPHKAGPLTTLAYILLLVSHNIAAFLLLPLVLASALLTLIWVGLPFTILTAATLRTIANAQRTTLTRLNPHHPVPTAYRPMPPTGVHSRVRVILTDPATWRDLLWLTSAPLLTLLALLSYTLYAHAIYQTLYALLLWRLHPDLYGFITPHTPTQALLILIPAALTLLLAHTLKPLTISAYTRLSRLILAPSEKARLTARVAHLATSRADTIDTQAAEIRRIERDLHDGAQARLIALGMNLGMAEQMIDTKPDTAKHMLAEARETTRHALTELRDLVRGIHPPVLVERGLDGAVHALALTHNLPITVTTQLHGRPGDPVESAAYFAIAELLTNTAKHAKATHAWVHINHGRQRLVITITDNGQGGAQPTPESGLSGIARRLDAFDGTINITSPPGGPTIVTLEIPCELSSPKTLPSSATD
ncbi:histidine kinase [Nocardiopsis terrae]|uniref:histidine kinase n=1 Tax=Nocardiopsis terrae TaxID=372655 RepID=A0ABR9HGV9_9ACTN|nr:sensor histidine kinase [Nocardiopsis terrae]MBE1458263.1 signal transduction histidine kinase [Nocardiopsis terrae]GHC81380.1 histidine kinase [Nocardiopsis terrae]